MSFFDWLWGKRRSLEPTSTQPPHLAAIVAKVKVTRSGQVFLNGQPTPLEDLRQAFQRLKTEGGVVWYYREDPSGEPPEEAMAVIQAVTDARLPIKLCEEDFD
jgi:hypothetical protein